MSDYSQPYKHVSYALKQYKLKNSQQFNIY